MNTIWSKLSKSKRYRAQFVSSNARRAFAFQLRAIMKKRGLSQEKLAELSGLTQGVISRAADPNYGTLTVTIKAKIAGGLDMAYLGTLVPFSDAAKWFSNLSEESVQVPTFEEENLAWSEALSTLGSVHAVKPDPSYDRRPTARAVAMSEESQYGGAERQGMYLQNEAA